MLNIHRRIDVDTGIQQLFHVLEALGVTTARNICVGELVDEDEAWTPLERGIEIELAQDSVDVDRRLAGNDLEAFQQRLRLLASVCLDHANDDVYTLLQLGARRLQHLIGLAHPGGCANEDFEAANATLLRAPGLG